MSLRAEAPAETLVDRLVRHARERPDAPAVVGIDRTVSYRELHAMVAGCADWLLTQGVEGGECVGVTIADDLLHFVVALGLATLGSAHATLASHEAEPARSRSAARVHARRIIATSASHRLPGLAFAPVDSGLIATWAKRGTGALRRRSSSFCCARAFSSKARRAVGSAPSGSAASCVRIPSSCISSRLIWLAAACSASDRPAGNRPHCQ